MCENYLYVASKQRTYTYQLLRVWNCKKLGLIVIKESVDYCKSNLHNLYIDID